MSNKYTPRTYTIPQPPTITTPNKHITSSFMRSDISYFSRSNRNIIDNKTYYIQLTDKIKIAEEIENKIEIIVEEEIYEIYSNIDNKPNIINLKEDNTSDNSINIGTNPPNPNYNYASIMNRKTLIYNRIFNILKDNNIKLRDNNILLIFNEIYNRTELIALIDIFIYLFNSYKILLLPHSLSLSLCNSISHSIIITFSNEYIRISIIEDYVLNIVKIIYPQGKRAPTPILVDDKDFVEEFKSEDIKKERIKKCSICGEYNTIDILSKHNHTMNNICVCTNPEEHNHIEEIEDTLEYEESVCNTLIKYLEKNIEEERLIKIYKNILILGIEDKSLEEKDNIINDSIESFISSMEKRVECNIKIIEDNAIIGGLYLNNTETAKELWMSESEWNNGRVRVLKEKILFNLK